MAGQLASPAVQMGGRSKIGIGVAGAVLVLGVVAGVALGAGGSSDERDGDASATADDDAAGSRRRPRATTSSTTTVPPTTTTTAAPPPPPTTAPQTANEDDETPAGVAPPPVEEPLTPPVPPPPMGTSPPYVETRPEAIDWSATCETTGPTTVVGTARIVWSDGFVDEFSATFTTPGYRQSQSGGQRGWFIIVNVVAPPGGAIGNYSCSNPSTSGAIYWDG